jgi:hypothetical protein
VATTYSGDEPDQLRGPQHDAAWADEPAKWKYPIEAWDNLELGLRSGSNPRIVATTAPCDDGHRIVAAPAPSPLNERRRQVWRIVQHLGVEFLPATPTRTWH